jgi:hypothetical protein
MSVRSQSIRKGQERVKVGKHKPEVRFNPVSEMPAKALLRVQPLACRAIYFIVKPRERSVPDPVGYLLGLPGSTSVMKSGLYQRDDWKVRRESEQRGDQAVRVV